MVTNTRRDAARPWNKSYAMIKWPGKFDHEATIALVYDREDELAKDYQKLTTSPQRSEWLTPTRTAHLEKDTHGRAYLNLGWRCYLNAGADKPSLVRFIESPTDRIYVPVAIGGTNRRQAVRQLRQAEVLWLQFHLLDGLTPEHVHRAARTFLHGILPCDPRTEPLLLRGLQILGTFVRPMGGKT